MTPAEDILRRVRQPDGVYIVRGRALSVAAALTLTLAGAFIAFASSEISSALGLAVGACLLIVAAIRWLDVVPRLFKPMLGLTQEGLQTAAYGFIPWEQITGVRFEGRAMLVSVPHRHELMSRAHPCARMLYDVGLYRRRNELRFGLTQVVAIVAEFLWREKTGWGGRSLPSELPPAAWLSERAQPPPRHQPRAS